jgi:ribosome-binding protein aMBF1 (putative translation factor)
MRLEGRVWKDGKDWLVEVPMLDVMTQGRTRKEALAMIVDAIESLANKKTFRAKVYQTDEESIEVGSSDIATLTALLLRRQREAHGLSLAEVSKRLGQTSRNAYARYERGTSVPTIDKLQQLLSIVSGRDFVLRPV